MSKSKDGQARGQYTLEFKQEAVRLVRGGQPVPVTAKILGMPEQTLGNWVRLSNQGRLTGADNKPVSAEQMELARLRAENARLKMERDILKKATAYLCPLGALRGKSCEVRLDCPSQSAMACHTELRSPGSQRQRLL